MTPDRDRPATGPNDQRDEQVDGQLDGQSDEQPGARPEGRLSEDEIARRSTAQMWGDDVASKALGMEIRASGPGSAVVAMMVRPDMVNGWEICHGGLIATLADSAFAVACNSRGVVTVASGFDVSFLQPGRLGDVLVATAGEVAVAGRSGVYDVVVTRDSDGETVALFRGRSRSTGRANPGLTPD